MPAWLGQVRATSGVSTLWAGAWLRGAEVWEEEASLRPPWAIELQTQLSLAPQEGGNPCRVWALSFDTPEQKAEALR